MSNNFSLDKLNQKIAHIWDENNIIRHVDIKSKTDYTYNNVIIPYVLNKIKLNTTKKSNILDIGCGCGYLTNFLQENDIIRIKGIDFSEKSIIEAKRCYPNIDFEYADILSYNENIKYDICLAIMTVNNMPDLNGFFEKVHELLNDSGKLILVLPHPFFWPIKHILDTDYKYKDIKQYNLPFSTKGRSDYSSEVIYFHRTMQYYLETISKNGFIVEKYEELYELKDNPDPDILGLVIKKIKS